MSEPISVSIVGGSGYVGGELLRLLLDHPHTQIGQVTSRSNAGKPIHFVHPNLRGVSDLKFTTDDQLDACDLLFLALPHGEASTSIDRFANIAPRVVDCSADFRLDSADTYARWYGAQHSAPHWLSKFVYGLPERFRDSLTDASFASGVGCNATVTTLALAPLADAKRLDRVVADIKVGSSEGGARSTAASHHPERSGSVRSFKPTGHRHQAEVQQLLGTAFDLSFSVTSVELVRGALVTAHCFLTAPVAERDLWKLYREHYGREPFVRLVNQRTGIHRYPEPKLVAGTNFCDIGFAVDESSEHHRVVVIAALDNLMKGAAGSAVQAMNVMCGFDETAGLTFPGLHPV